MEVESIELDHNDNCIRETSIESLISPGSPDPSNISGDPLLNPRVGDEYQVTIPHMITESEHLKLLANPIDLETSNTSHSFLMGLPIPIIWSHDKEERLGSTRSSDGTVDVNKPLDARNGKTDRTWSRKKSSELNVESLKFVLELRGESKPEKLEPILADEIQLDGSKSYYPIPGLTADPWRDSEVDSFLLGLYIFGKNFFQIKRFMGNKDMGEILSFYYGKFYRSDAYRRWSDSRKIKRKKCVTGRKIFIGWRQQELLSRLSSHVSEDSQNSLLEGYKSFAEGRSSLEEYVSSLKSSVSIPVLVEAVGIGKGKEDLTGFAMEPAKSSHDVLVCPLLPTGQACSSLTSDDIVNFLTGGFRLSKARCNDIFWEAVWPRLLAKGWHSEQPKNQGYHSSKHYLVFLMPGIQKFSRRRLVKGEHYFDSVSDVLNKVASEPKLLELEAEESSVRGQNEQDAWSTEVASDQDDHSDSQRHCYLKPRVSACTLSQMKFTVVDTSLLNGGKSSSIKELRHLPAEFEKTSKETNYSMENEKDDYEDDVDEFEPVEKLFQSEKAKHHKGRSDSGGPNCMKFTVVDTSLVHEGKSSKVRELRYSPVVVKSASELTGLLRKTVTFEDSSRKHEKDATDISSKGKKKKQKSNLQKDICDNENQVATKNNSDFTNKMGTQVDQNTSISGEKHLKKTVLHQFKRRSKSGHSDYVVPLIKRRRLTACAKAKIADPSQNGPLGLGSKQMELQQTTSSPETNKNIISQVRPQEKESSITYLAERSPNDVNSKILRQNCCDIHTSETRNEKHQAEASNQMKPAQTSLLDSKNNEMLVEEVEGNERLNMNGDFSPSKEKELVSETLRTSTDVDTMNRRHSKRNRPLTARALEALANGFLNVQRRPKSTDVLSGENPFSSPCRKARSKVKVTPSHADPVTVASGKEEVNGACDDKKHMISKPLDQVEEKWLSNH